MSEYIKLRQLSNKFGHAFINYLSELLFMLCCSYHLLINVRISRCTYLIICTFFSRASELFIRSFYYLWSCLLSVNMQIANWSLMYVRRLYILFSVIIAAQIDGAFTVCQIYLLNCLIAILVKQQLSELFHRIITIVFCCTCYIWGMWNKNYHTRSLFFIYKIVDIMLNALLIYHININKWGTISL